MIEFKEWLIASVYYLSRKISSCVKILLRIAKINYQKRFITKSKTAFLQDHIYTYISCRILNYLQKMNKNTVNVEVGMQNCMFFLTSNRPMTTKKFFLVFCFTVFLQIISFVEKGSTDSRQEKSAQKSQIILYTRTFIHLTWYIVIQNKNYIFNSI